MTTNYYYYYYYAYCILYIFLFFIYLIHYLFISNDFYITLNNLYIYVYIVLHKNKVTAQTKSLNF